MSVLNFVAFYR